MYLPTVPFPRMDLLVPSNHESNPESNPESHPDSNPESHPDSKSLNPEARVFSFGAGSPSQPDSLISPIHTPAAGDFLLISSSQLLSTASGAGDPPSALPAGHTPSEENITRSPTSVSGRDATTQGENTEISFDIPVLAKHIECQTLGPSTNESACQTQSFAVKSFSSKTCIELLTADLLTPAQIIHEHSYFRSLNHERPLNRPSLPQVSSSGQNTYSKKVLKSELADSVCMEFEASNQSHNLTHQSFSYLLDEAERHIRELISLRQSPQSPAAQSPATGRDSTLDSDNLFNELETMLQRTRQVLDEPSETTTDEETGNVDSIDPTPTVCRLLECSLLDISVDQVLSELPPDESSSCGRRVGHWGSAYGYGRVVHPARDLPESKVLDTIYSEISKHDPTFIKENFSVMCTLYPDGNSYIPSHQDNERVICKDSMIYTISFGATRVFRVTSRSGALLEHDYDLEHGQVLAMSAASQADWSHELVANPGIKCPRVSLTFRHIVPAESLPPPASAPPIERPTEPRTYQDKAAKSKILFLTDSILSSTPEHLFERVPNHRCIKKKNYYLADTFNFEAEFKFCSMVVIGGGVNDLTTRRDNKSTLTAPVLADLFVGRLRRCCEKHPNTKFVFNSILDTKIRWLNAEADTFNRIMFDLSMTIPNLEFLDLHAALIRNPMSDRADNILDSSDRRGTHLTLRAKRVLSEDLVSALKLLCLRSQGVVRGYSMRGWNWPLRKQFRERTPGAGTRRR